MPTVTDFLLSDISDSTEAMFLFSVVSTAEDETISDGVASSILSPTAFRLIITAVYSRFPDKQSPINRFPAHAHFERYFESGFFP